MLFQIWHIPKYSVSFQEGAHSEAFEFCLWLRSGGHNSLQCCFAYIRYALELCTMVAILSELYDVFLYVCVVLSSVHFFGELQRWKFSKKFKDGIFGVNCTKFERIIFQNRHSLLW